MQQTYSIDRQLRVVPRAARVAVAAYFFCNGAAVANWLVRIPEIQLRLGLGAGALGLALLGATLGATTTMLVSGALVARFGSRRVTWLAAVLFSVLLPLPAMAASGWQLFLSLALVGVCNGALDVAMNAQAVAVERHYRRSIMASLHGTLSIGSAVGALAGGGFAALGITPALHLLSVAVVLGLGSLIARRWLLPATADASSSAPAFARPTRAIAGLGMVGFCVLLNEGAMAEWSSIYLHTVLAADTGAAAFGFMAFSVAMAAGRLAGDRLAQRLGAVALVRFSGFLAAAGLLLVVFGGNLVVAVMGFACAGAGLASVFPLVMSAAARTPGMASSLAIAAVSTMGYAGFLAGPPIIGFVAETFTLRGAFVMLAVLCMAIVVLARTVQRAET